MKKLTKLQTRILFGFFIAGIVLVSGGVFYLNKMATVSGALNITKVEQQDKIYTYSVYSDFYFRISRYDRESIKRSQFSEIIPTKVKIGYEFIKGKPKSILSEGQVSDSTPLIRQWTDSTKILDTLRRFSTTYGKIVTTQDQHYFDSASKRLYKNMNYLKPSDGISTPQLISYYEPKITIPIANLSLKPFKLTKIKENLRSHKIANVDKWQPNIVEWVFGENDRVYFQYLLKFEDKDPEQDLDLDAFLLAEKESKALANTTVVKTIKINNNKVQKMFFKISRKDHKITAYFMDKNAYVYNLILKVNNIKSMESYLDDYLKIAFGIYFKDAKNFHNWFADKQNETEGFHKEYLERLIDIKMLDIELEKEQLLKHFSLTKNVLPIVYYKKNETLKDNCSKLGLECSKVKFDQALKNFKKIHGLFPTANILKEEFDDKRLILEAWDKTEPSFINLSSKKTLKDYCDNLECIKKLKDNNWSVE